MINKNYRTIGCQIAVFAAMLCFAAALAAQTATASSAQPQEWKTYSYPADGFSASFPSEPELQKNDIPTDAGSFELRSYIAQVGSAAVFVGVCDYGSSVEGRAPDTVLQGAKNGALEKSSAHLLREKKITLGIYQGLEFESESDSAHFYARIYIVGTTLYQTLVVAPINQPYGSSTRFLDSFQLIARAAK